MAYAVRSKPYVLDYAPIGDITDLARSLPTWLQNADFMFGEVYDDLQGLADDLAALSSSSSSSGVTAVVNDTNVTGSIAGSTLTLGWTGTLSVARGGMGAGTHTAYAVLCGGTTGTGAIQSVAALGASGTVLTSNGAGALPTFQSVSSGIFPSTATQGDIFYASAANTISALAKNTSATRYLSNTGTSNNPAWAQVDVTNGITGAVPIANGGTNLTGFAQGDILYASALNTLAKLAKDTNATRYLSNTGTSNAPAWAQVDVSNGVTGDLPFANLTQGSALSVLGVTGNATADVASIAAGSDGQVLRRSGTALAFGAVDLASANAITGNLPVTNLGSGTSAGATTFWRGDGSWASVASTVGVTDLDALFVSARWGTVTTRAAGTSYESANMTPNTIAGASSNQSDTTGVWFRYASAGTINTGAGLAGSTTNGWIRGDQSSYFYCKMRTVSSITNCRFWIGWSSTVTINSTLLSNDNPGTSTSMAAVRYSDGTDSNWIGVTSDGTTQQTTASLGAIATNTVYEIKITGSGSGFTFQVNSGTARSLSGSQPTTAMFPICVVTDKNGSVKNIDFNRFYVRGG